MVVSSNSELPYTYAPLSPGLNAQEIEQSPTLKNRSWRVGLAILSGLMIFALIMGFVSGPNDNAGPNNNKRDDHLMSLLRPAPENLASVEVGPGGEDLVFMVTRGRTHGVSEKANDLPLRGLGSPVFDWNDLQLAWQRTGFHFQPRKNWMNDPNGPLFYKGWYHLFYQYNPGAAVWGNIVWAHAVSKDLINWEHLPLAMVADHWYDFNGVWTGSATFLPDGQIMMLYTGSTNESVQVQNLAYPADLSDPLLREWVKYPGNPVLVPPTGVDKLDFRDPTTAWLTSEGKWRITIGSKNNVNKTGIALVYETSDFMKYRLLDNILHSVQHTGMWECVDFYPVSVSESNGLDTSVDGPLVKHVLKASMDDDRQDYYALGTYDEGKVSWVPDNPSVDVGVGLRYDWGGKFYASKTFYDQEKKRRILWGWIPESDSEAADVKKGWSALQAIPRTVLYDQKTGSNLILWPVEEVETLRQESKNFDKVVVSPGSIVPLDVGYGTEMDITAEFEVDQESIENLPVSDEEYSCPTSKGAIERGALGPFGFLVLTDGDLSEQTPVYFYIVKTSGGLKTFFCTDLTRSSIANDVAKDVFGSTVPVLKGENLSMRILIDHSIVEAFAQGGRTCITTRVYPTKAIYKDAKLYLFNNATTASVTASTKTWQMSSARTLYYSIWVHLMLMFSPFFLIGGHQFF